jgi:hypothetical protein
VPGAQLRCEHCQHQADLNGFDIWIAYGIPSVVPAPNIRFHWIAVGS